ncbi:hypothetical protein DLM45_08890 [Hyphomicrobium methylovorum]|uniref:COG4223 family protein n=1 Tax=Hyphomicrobium methylovorum TaxID=84 RepID=UPI0015E7BD00|nr:hypothetical protein [Hyphomicrobium methylovorum]MBA2126338.1 hypothetical protein [Hyphomicrobium methylovorum]
MADDKVKAGKGTPPGAAGNRPHATLDLKATEIKVTPVTASPQPSSARPAPSAAETPRPLPASFYATAPKTEPAAKVESRPRVDAGTAAKEKTTSAAQPSAPASAKTSKEDAAPTIPARRGGGIFSHLAAGALGGLVAFLGMQWALPELGLDGSLSTRFDNDTAAISERIAGLEKRVAHNTAAPDLGGIEQRITTLEHTAQSIPALTESQNRLVADTKAALAAAASDAGSPQLIERLGKVEDRLKALADIGANSPSAGPVEQFAALSAKIRELETNVAQASPAANDSVLKDIEARLATATAAGEAAKSGVDRIAGDIKAAQSETTQLQAAIEGLKASSAKPADINAAVTPLSTRIASIEKNLQAIEQSETARQASAEHVLLSLELQNLKRAIERGGSYTAELNAVKKIAGTGIDLAPLAKLEATGVPSQSDLAKEFRTAAANAIDANNAPEAATVVGRLWSEAKSVVRVRRIDHNPDDKSTEATVGRMQVALNEGRLQDVLEAAKDLPPSAADAAAPFLEKVAARVSIDDAIAQLESRLKASVAETAPVRSQH